MDLPAGQLAAGPVGLIDLYPTLASLTGLPAPEYLDGNDLPLMLRDPRAKVNEAVFSPCQDGYSVRTSRWRCTKWNQGKGADTLFDMLNDSAETNNLADDPEKIRYGRR